MEKVEREDFYDVVVVGGGPAGLTAALYLARARYRVLVVEKEHFGGQITITSEVVNYPGVKSVSGEVLTEIMRDQAKNFGAEFKLAQVKKLDLSGDMKKVYTDKGEMECFGILIATGAHPRKIGFPGEEKFMGRGVAYCATCDGEFFTGKEVFVIGGGFAAAEESVFLTKYAKHVTILVREDDFTCADSVADQARKNEKITVHFNTEVVEASGGTQLAKLVYRNNKTGKEVEYLASDGETFGIFVFAGYEPATELVAELIELDKSGYIITDKQQKTSAEGVYAAGDVCVKDLRQVVTAVGDGALAATELERYVKVMQEKTGVRAKLTMVRDSQKSFNKEEKHTGEDTLFSDEMMSQLNAVFDRMEEKLVLEIFLDHRPVAVELKGYMEGLEGLTDKLSIQMHLPEEGDMPENERPCVRVCKSDGTWTGLAFHGVPGGHEFTSFVLGLYNASGTGQPLDKEVEQRIHSIKKPKDIKIMVSLSCTMCPELVTAVQHIAAKNELVTAQVYDLNHFEEMKEQYQVMSVPCMIVNEGEPLFGKKNLEQVLEILL